MKYDYSFLKGKISDYSDVFSIGKSLENRDIFCFKIGTGDAGAVFAAGFHALEYLTVPALLSFADKFLNMIQYHNRISAYFVPSVNPDGIEIAVNGLNPKNPYHKDIINSVGIIDFKNAWQANAAGVDINHNFNAQWQKICDKCAPTRYGGEFPHSEPETRAVASLLTKIKPELFVAFHSQGKEIYYDFNGLENKCAKENAEFVAKKCGYIAETPTGTASFGGAKDWYIQEFNKEAYTIELGLGKNPLPDTELNEMKNDVFNICTEFIDRVFIN